MAQKARQVVSVRNSEAGWSQVASKWGGIEEIWWTPELGGSILKQMGIQIDPHTIVRAQERGVTIQEIHDVLDSGEDISAKGNRLGKMKVYDFQDERNGKFYPQKKIEVYYVCENDKIITVTVYAYYGNWRNKT